MGRKNLKYTSLHWAVAHYTLARVKTLIEYNTDLHEKDNDDKSVLYCASVHGRYETCKYLLELDRSILETADIDMAMILENGHTKIFYYFIKLGVPPSRNCILQAAYLGNLSLCRFLLKNPLTKDDWFDCDLINPMHVAMERGRYL